jgi:hypothetical protein
VQDCRTGGTTPAPPPAADEPDDEKPSDLSFKSFFAEPAGSHLQQPHHYQRTEAAAGGATTDQTDAYKSPKFKSNITQRFSLQDSTTMDLPPEDSAAAGGCGKIRPAHGDSMEAEPTTRPQAIKTEGVEPLAGHRPSPGSRDCRSSSNSGGGDPTGLLPVIRERLPPLPGFHTSDSEFSSPVMTVGASATLSTGGKPQSATPMDLLMPTLAPIHPAVCRSPSRAPPPVPIFALNAKGSYYVPMSVDLSVIAPFMALYTEETYTVLHPVTISVNFQVS